MPNDEYGSPIPSEEKQGGETNELQDEENMESTNGEEENESEQKKSISADLIRGHINTIILRALFEGDRYGYDIINEIEQKSHGQYQLKQPTLYSALKRLETQGYVKSYWGGVSNGGRRRYFSLTDEGREVVKQNQAEWEYSRTIIDNLISEKDFDFSNPAPQKLDFRILRQSTSRTPIITEEKLYDPQYVSEVTISYGNTQQTNPSETESNFNRPGETDPALSQTSPITPPAPAADDALLQKTEEREKTESPTPTQEQAEQKQQAQNEENFSLPLFSSLSEQERNYKDIIASIYRKAIKPQTKPTYAPPTPPQPQPAAPEVTPTEIKAEQAQKTQMQTKVPAEQSALAHENAREEIRENVTESTPTVQTQNTVQQIDITERKTNETTATNEAKSTAPTYVSVEESLKNEQAPHEQYKEEKKTASAKIDFYDVVEQARYDGLRVWTSEPTKEKKSLPEDFFNKGLALLQASLVFFVIAVMECLFVIFFKDKLFTQNENLQTPYIVVMLVCAVLLPFVCACLYFSKYQPCCKRFSNNTVIYNSIVLFIVLFILLIIIDLLIDFPLTDKTALLLYLVIPGVYLLNIIVFSVSYYLLSRGKKTV